MKTIRYDTLDNKYGSVIAADKIVRLFKSDDGEITYIHLTTGDILESSTSMHTLEARMNE